MVIDPSFWRSQRVFLTGHTGFKGSWASLLLSSLGAHVSGYALAPESERDIFIAASVADYVEHQIGDVRDLNALIDAVKKAQPTIVLHMAAQALVRKSYLSPVETYSTNVLGTVHLLEAVRQVDSVRSVVVVTSDKCYDNNEWAWGYREIDRLGGRDPYSSSKGCAELVTAAYRDSFFGEPVNARIATARAGNVIGGGDWSSDRLIPDAVRAIASQEILRIRFPSAVRPWQHVLDPLLGYLRLAEMLATGSSAYEGGWNFGPEATSEVSVEAVLGKFSDAWGHDLRLEKDGFPQPHEAKYLKLDCSKAQSMLGWESILDFDTAISLTIDWYRAYLDCQDMRQVTLEQINQVLKLTREELR